MRIFSSEMGGHLIWQKFTDASGNVLPPSFNLEIVSTSISNICIILPEDNTFHCQCHKDLKFHTFKKVSEIYILTKEQMQIFSDIKNNPNILKNHIQSLFFSN